MKIIRKDKYSECEFGELKVGDVCIEDADGAQFIQMKTEEVEDNYHNPYNAVVFTTGELYYVDPRTKVRRVHAELIISNIEEAD